MHKIMQKRQRKHAMLDMLKILLYILEELKTIVKFSDVENVNRIIESKFKLRVSMDSTGDWGSFDLTF